MGESRLAQEDLFVPEVDRYLARVLFALLYSWSLFVTFRFRHKGYRSNRIDFPDHKSSLEHPISYYASIFHTRALPQDCVLFVYIPFLGLWNIQGHSTHQFQDDAGIVTFR